MSNANSLTYGTVADRRDGSYMGRFTITTAGKYSFSALLATQVIVQEVPVQIVAGDPSTPQIFLENLIPVRITAGFDIAMNFQLRDQYSNLISECADIAAYVYVLKNSSIVYNQTITSCNSGLMNISLSIRSSGVYQIVPAWKKFSLVGSIFGSPFPCIVVSASADPTMCTAVSRYLKIGKQNPVEVSSVGMKRDMTIFAADSWGNSILSDPFSIVESFMVYLAAAGQRCSPACPSTCDPLTGLPATSSDICVSSQITNHYDSTYTAEWSVNVSDSYLVVVSLRGVLIQSSPYSYTAAAGQMSLNRSKIYEVPANALAGESVRFFAQTVDNYGNNLSMGGQVCATLAINPLHCGQFSSTTN
jgi:hypothetical protein